jgi:hypothetical protein
MTGLLQDGLPASSASKGAIAQARTQSWTDENSELEPMVEVNGRHRRRRERVFIEAMHGGARLVVWWKTLMV